MKQIEDDTHLIKINQEKHETIQALAELRKRSRFALFIASIALFFTVIGIAAGYKNWMQINDRAKQAALGVTQLTEQSSHFADKENVLAFNQKLLDNLAKRQQQLNLSIAKLETVKRVTQRASKGLTQQASLLIQQQQKFKATTHSPNTAWKLAQVRFLLKIANQRLYLNKDKKGALEALEQAEMELIKLHSKKYLPVREKLNQEIVFLESYFVPNLTAISQHIMDLIEIIDAMPVASEIIQQQKITLLPKPKPEDTGFLSSLVKEINTAVIIKKFDPSVHNTMGIDDKEKLKNLLHLRFETLRLMALQRLDYAYHQQLELIKKMLKKYYSEMIDNSLQKLLDQLDKVELSPIPPDISSSLKLLDKISKE